MQTVLVASLLSAVVALSACGRSTESRAATGGLGGAVVAGPIGAAAGALAGAATAPD